MRLDVRARVVGEVLKRIPGASISTMTPDDIKRQRRRGLPRNALTIPFIGRLASATEIEDRILPTRAGYLPVRCYRPRRATAALPVVAHFHGGGWVFGDLDSGDWLCSHVAARADVLVVAVDYCLAPEHPFPAAVDECLAAVDWLGRNSGEVGGDPARLAVMGDSAGGNLAAVVSQLARDAGGPHLSHQVLIYPSTDATMSSPSIHAEADPIGLTSQDMEAFLRHYLGDADPSEPRVSPLLAGDLTGLPPALIQTAEHDPLRDDGERYARALREAGVDVRYTEYLGAPHGFVNRPGLVRAAHQALAEIVHELRVRLHAS